MVHPGSRWLAAVVLAIWTWIAASPACAEGRTLVIGSISPRPASEIREWLPFAQHLAGRLAADGISKGDVEVTQTAEQMAGLLRSGAVDLYFDSPLISLVVSDLAGSRLFLRGWKGGVADYRSVIFVRADSGIEDIDGLKGKMIAFEKLTSSTGYLLPWLLIAERRLVMVAGQNSAVTADRIGFTFSGDDDTTISWVLRRQVAAGASSDTDLAKISEDRRKHLKAIASSPPIPRQVVSHSAMLPPALAARIRDELIAMATRETGRKVLEGFNRTTKFDDIPADSARALEAYRPFVRSLTPG